MWLPILGKSDLDSGSYWFPLPLLLDQFLARYISSRHRLACNNLPVENRPSTRKSQPFGKNGLLGGRQGPL
jgi:hypothetical protein